LDAENYGGVLLKSATSDDDEELHTEQDEQDQQDDELEIVSHWNIANYLPRGIDDYFLLLVGQFIRRRAEYQRRDRAKHKTNIHHDDDEADDQAQLAEEDQEAALSPLAKYSQRIVANYFSDKLLRIVPEIQTYNMGPESFPVHAGSHLQLESPSLELVKFVSAVFQLEPSVDAQVQKMKRTLLKLLQVSEFADQAAFRNPSLCFAVADVICQSCNLCRSVDLCRDPQLFKITASGAGDQDESRADTDDADASGSSSSSATTWHCPRCFSLYDKAALEARLVEMVQAQSVQYQLQDLQCRKCGLPAEHKMREYCTCSGTYALPPGAKERLVETLRLLHRVAQQHAFVWLLETVERLELGLV
jgi:DNA polymerase epsilon subunit 1